MIKLTGWPRLLEARSFSLSAAVQRWDDGTLERSNAGRYGCATDEKANDETTRAISGHFIYGAVCSILPPKAAMLGSIWL